MALTRAQYLSGNNSDGVTLVGQPQGVRPGGAGIAIAPDGTISVDPATAIGLVKLNNPGSYNDYIWPLLPPGNPSLLASNPAGVLSWVEPGGGLVGTVSSVDVSGGTTGLLFTGGPVTSIGVITASGTLNIANGGTGATTAATAINNLLPPQAGSSGYVLTSDGVAAGWSNPSSFSVTQIIPGSNVTISPISGRGAVTINSTGGGGGGGLTGLQEIDDISTLFNGTRTSFPVTITGGQPIPAGPGTSQLVIAVGGILQTPGDSFIFDNATDTLLFTSAPPAGVTFAGYVGGNADPITEIVAGPGLSGGGTSGVVTINNQGVISLTANAGLTGGGTGAVTVGIANTGVTAGSYQNANITVNARGQVTAASEGSGGVPSGAVLAFYQAAAPSGWTRLTTAALNDAAIRLVTTSGGTTGGSSGFGGVFASRTVPLPVHSHGVSDPGHTHSVSDPGHSHGVNDPGHTHTVRFNQNNNGSNPNQSSDLRGFGNTQTTTSAGTGISINGSVTGIGIAGRTTGISINNAGSGSTMDFAVKYANFIVCQKD